MDMSPEEQQDTKSEMFEPLTVKCCANKTMDALLAIIEKNRWRIDTEHGGFLK